MVDNLDELEMSTDMRKLLTGHWKQAARGHIIITTRRVATEIGEEMVIEESSCIELKRFTEEEGVQEEVGQPEKTTIFVSWLESLADCL